jgi:acyl-CoA synthetase (AMP-forming)/AMP-acid ligase II
MYPGRHAIENPDQPAVIMKPGGEVVTYRQFEDRANRVAHLLRAAGLQRGDHISILMENNPRMLEIEAGADGSGCTTR